MRTVRLMRRRQTTKQYLQIIILSSNTEPGRMLHYCRAVNLSSSSGKLPQQFAKRAAESDPQTMYKLQEAFKKFGA